MHMMKLQITGHTCNPRLDQYRINLVHLRAWCNTMVALSAAIAGEGLELQMVPDKAAADGSGLNNDSLHPVDWHNHIGQRKQAAPPPEPRSACINAVKAKAIFADESADDTANHSHHNDREKHPDKPDKTRRSA